MSFHEQLKKARLHAGLKQIDVANALGITAGAYSSYESGKRNPDVHKIHQLSNILGVTGDWLLGLDTSDTTQQEISISPEDRSLIDKYRMLSESSQSVVTDLINHLLDLEAENQPDQDTEQFPFVYTVMPYHSTAPSAGDGNEFLDSDSQSIRIKETPEAQHADYVLHVSGHSMEPEYFDGDLVLVKKQDSIDDGEIGIFSVDGESFIKQKKPGCLHSLNTNYPDVKLNEFSTVYTLGKVIGKAEL